ncbi:hypothetical protein JCM5350_007222 [Sporobolomyces pararoseus]
MPSSSTGIERSVSPSPRSRSLPLSSNSNPNGHDTRYRQPNTTYLQQPHPFTPEVGYHPTSKVGGYSHGNGYSNGYAQTGGGGGIGMGMLNGNHLSHSHSPAHSHEQGTLSTLLTQVYRSAITTFSPSSSSNSQPFANIDSSSSSSLLNKLRPSSSPHLSSSSPRTPSTTTATTSAKLTVPSASTVGFILLCCLWYLSSALSSNTGKSILTRFRYPVTLTFVQFAFVAGYSLLVLAVRNQLTQFRLHRSRTSGGVGSKSRRSSFGAGAVSSMNTLQGWGVRKPSKHMFNGTLMMSLFQIAGHVFSSMAIARVPVSTVHTIKALSPLFTVLSYVALFGVRYSTPTYISLFPLTIGVMLACSFDLRANAIGFLCALGSTFIFVAQNIFSKKLLPKESSGGGLEESKSVSGGGGGGGGGNAKLDKMNLLFYSSGMAFFLMIPIWLYSDASSLFFSTPPTSSTTTTPLPENTTASLVFYFFLNGTVHFGQNLLAFSLLARTSPVTYSIASLVKRIAVICIAIVWFGQKVKPIQGFGMTLTFAGLYMYNQSKSSVEKGEKKRIMVEKKRGMELPTSLEDARAMDNSSSSGTDSPLEGGSTPILKSQSPRNRTSFEQQTYNPYHPPPVPPPPHATGTSTHEGGQVSRNRQTSLPTTSTVENGVNHHHHQQYNPYTSSSSSNSHSTTSAPPTHQLPQQQQHSPHTGALGSSGSAIQVGYR